MTIEVVHGDSRNREAAKLLAATLRDTVDEGTVYFGYPVLVTADERVDIDALLVSPEYGVVAFQFSDNTPRGAAQWAAVIDQQDRLYAALDTTLRKHDALRTGRQLAVSPQTATIFPDAVRPPQGQVDGFFGTVEEVGAWIEGLAPLPPGKEKALQAALQRVTTIKPAKRRQAVRKERSRGALLKIIEQNIANLDRWQKAAAIESPEGIQRIRGLAGSGKTVVLALKAAYLHTNHPDWQIAFTFHTRALYQQISDLVTRFSFAQSDDRPDAEHLRIMHSWGSRAEPGVYSHIAAALDAEVRDWAYARAKYGMDDAFRGVCRELLDIARATDVTPIFDAVLIDEAQDLPPEFFQLVYLFTKHPHRIVFGYDEMQKLSESGMPDMEELFGQSADGSPTLDTSEDEPRRDIVLPVCYRNSPWALATAHAVGIGVYRQEGLLQHPDRPQLWQDIGYRVASGKLRLGAKVSLERAPESAPPYFAELISATDALTVQQFPDELAQDAWIAQQIKHNLDVDELEHDDILIVLPDTYRAKSRAPRLAKQLLRLGVESHLVGVSSSRDEVFVPGSIAIAHIHRAKGNEAPMVYVVDAQLATGGINLVTKRNTLFTAITRSRAWVRVSGYGVEMSVLAAEIEAVRQRDYRLSFTIPSASALRKMRHIYRERSASEEEAVRRTAEAFTAALEGLERGDLDLDDFPPALRSRLRRILGEGRT